MPEREEPIEGPWAVEVPNSEPVHCATESVCGTRPLDLLTPVAFFTNLKVLAVQEKRFSIPHVHAYWTLHRVLLDTPQRVGVMLAVPIPRILTAGRLTQ